MKICVFAASSSRIDEKYLNNAFTLAKQLALSGHTLVYGGGKEGIMGAFARGFKAGKGHIEAVVPEFYADIVFDGCDEVILTESMSTRKQKLIEMADAMIAMEGGIGTYDELFEAMCMNMCETICKPLLVYNKHGYYSKLIEILKDNTEEKFISDLNSFQEVKSDEEVLKILGE